MDFNRIFSLLFFLRLCITFISGVPPDAEVLNLPGVDFQLNFRHYSGYLNTTDNTRKFHYWFLESQNDSSNDPLVLWLTGGPGCSSLGGLLDENGPFKVKDQGRRLSENVYSWNKVANVLYLDSPANVGFSYSKVDFIASDDGTADDNHAALVDFLAQFPDYKNRSFFVTGESYAGIYIPTLTVRLLKDTTNFPNFKGMAIGNGLLDEVLNIQSLANFLYYHGLVSEKSWKFLQQECRSINSTYDPWEALTDPKFNQTLCQNLTTEVLDFPDISGNDPYDLFYACYPDSNSAVYDRISQRVRQKFPKKNFYNKKSNKMSEEECSENNWNERYLNQKEVLEALHIVKESPYWKSCSYNVSMTYNSTYLDVREQFKEILNRSDFRSLIYNGDTDMACNFLGDQIFVDQMGQKLLRDKDAWRYEGSIVDIAGYATIYERLDFLTVRGSGHFVPTSKPREALQMLSNFLQGSSNYSRPCLVSTYPQPLISTQTTSNASTWTPNTSESSTPLIRTSESSTPPIRTSESSTPPIRTAESSTPSNQISESSTTSKTSSLNDELMKCYLVFVSLVVLIVS